MLFYNSGRSKANSRFDRLVEIPFDGFLFGGCHSESARGEVLYRSDISKEGIALALDLEKQFDLLIIYEGVHGVYKRKGILPKFRAEELEDISVLKDDKAYPMSKFSIIKKELQCGYEPVPEQVLERLSKHYIIIDLVNYVECIQKGHGKDVIILKTLEKLGLDVKNTYAFGDSLNDLPMFEVCQSSIAIGHSPSELKNLAVYVTKEEENGVWEALNALGFVE